MLQQRYKVQQEALCWQWQKGSQKLEKVDKLDNGI